MHCSWNEEQVARVFDNIYKTQPDEVTLLGINMSSLALHDCEIRNEPADPNDPDSELFPHIYGGLLPLTAVASATPYPHAA